MHPSGIRRGGGVELIGPDGADEGQRVAKDRAHLCQSAGPVLVHRGMGAQRVGLGRGLLPAQAMDRLLRLECGDPYLRVEREHVDREPDGEQLVGVVAMRGSMRLPLVEPRAEGSELVEEGGDEELGEVHGTLSPLVQG